MGIWYSHGSFGNMLGSLIAGVFVNDAWGWSFIVPGLLILGMGLLTFLFLVPYPEELGLFKPDEREKLEGVTEYSLCLFCTKLVSYTFLFWLPSYIRDTIGLTASNSAYLSTVFDMGGIVGGILAGHLSDIVSSSSTVCSVLLALGVPSVSDL
ncbi:unnamed protein product [Echinostoma caproni]|uniref:MFS domain-containing protein n=1 Tax=Echinostoma caproni TaxID=27848 RepID=A0A182ZZ82_9TREM|nr:unnamed protein product [Echinostoma caproni]